MSARAEGYAPSTAAALAERAMLPLERLFGAAIAFCIVISLVVVLPGVHGHWILPAADLVLDTVACVVAGVLTARAWSRFRERGVRSAVYHAGAFLALTVAYASAVAISLAQSASIGTLARPEDLQLLVFDVARLAAALLFVIAGAFTARRTYGSIPHSIVLVPTLAVVATAVVGGILYPPPDALRIVTFPDPSGLPVITPLGAVLHVATALLFFVGAAVSRRLWKTGPSLIDGWIAVGLVFAGFAEFHWTLYPSAHPGQVSTADLLRLLCSVMLLVGLEVAARDNLRALEGAHRELAELHEVEVERAALEERARLARELHDGLAQDLWLAKLKMGRLARLEGLPEDAAPLFAETEAAIDSGLAEARQAVLALRIASSSDDGFCALMQRYVTDFIDRFGIRVEFTCAGDEADVDPRSQAEILRIAQEALTNVRHHADATVIGMRLTIRGGRIALRIVDNGRGFDPSATSASRFGLTTMRERAALIGGRLDVRSAPGHGTAVVMVAPVRRGGRAQTVVAGARA